MSKCWTVGCKNEGNSKPVLMLRVKSKGPAAEATMELILCGTCRRECKTIDDLLDDKGWSQLCAAFTKQGHAKPVKACSSVAWELLV